MLAGAESRDDVLGVDTGRRDHVDDVDRRIRGDLVPLVIGIDVGFVEAVELRELHALLARTGDGRDQLDVLRLEQRGRELAIGVAAQAAQGEAEGLTAGFRGAQGRSKGITGGQATEGSQERTTRRAHRGMATPTLPPTLRKFKVGAA